MRFDNSARMQQLDVIMKSKKTSSRRCKGGTRSTSSRKSDSGSRASSGSDVLSDVSSSRAHNTLSGSSHHSRLSRSSHSASSRAPGCKHVVRLQESWRRLKEEQVSETDIGKNIITRLIESASKAPQNESIFEPDDIENLAMLLVETIDAIVIQAGPTLFEEDFESVRMSLDQTGVDSCQVAEVLLEGLRDSSKEDTFSDNTVRAWQCTVVDLLFDWGDEDDE